MADSDSPHPADLSSRVSPETLERHEGTAYILSSDLRLTYMNPAWFRFAAENGGEPDISSRWTFGSSVLDAITGPLKNFYRDLYLSALEPSARDSLHPIRHEYECSSASTFRRMLLALFSLDGPEGILAVHSPILERPHDPGERAPREPDETTYRDDNGLIRQCSHCRRVRSTQEDRWDWVPRWVEHPPAKTSHGLCEICVDYYYGTASSP